MNPAEHNILAISGGSSSIKFAIFAAGSSFYMKSKGQIKRIGTLYCLFSVQGNDLSERFINPVVAQDHMFAIRCPPLRVSRDSRPRLHRRGHDHYRVRHDCS